VTSAEMDELVRRANASGFESIAEYAVALEAALLKIAKQGLGTWSQERQCMIDANGEPWLHWAARADMAFAPRQPTEAA
jgi:hypothetical protein